MGVEQYRDQVKLLLDLLPVVMSEPDFALKGGTAINLFEWDLPRLSVDIDLTYLPLEDRSKSLTNISHALQRVQEDIQKRFRDIEVTRQAQGNEAMEVKLHCRRYRTQVKIEVNSTTRGHLLPVRDMTCSEEVQNEFEAFVKARVVAHGELFGGKICAALDRQHPRYLFDVKQLLETSGITEEIRLGIIAAMVSHGRPIAELISPNIKDQKDLFAAQFEGMAFRSFTYADHQSTLEELITLFRQSLTSDDRAFLRSFEAGEPDWGLYPIETLRDLPAPRFKLRNIQIFREQQPQRHAQGLDVLAEVLND